MFVKKTVLVISLVIELSKQTGRDRRLIISAILEVTCLAIERLRFTFTPNRKREFVPRDHVSPLFFVYCLLLLLKNK